MQKRGSNLASKKRSMIQNPVYMVAEMTGDLATKTQPEALYVHEPIHVLHFLLRQISYRKQDMNDSKPQVIGQLTVFYL